MSLGKQIETLKEFLNNWPKDIDPQNWQDGIIFSNILSYELGTFASLALLKSSGAEDVCNESLRAQLISMAAACIVAAEQAYQNSECEGCKNCETEPVEKKDEKITTH